MALQNGINWLQSLAGFPAPPQPESQAESQPPAPAPPTARALSSPWLATHVENVVRETQQSAFRGTYELVRVVSARDATPAGRGGEVRVSDGRHSCRVFVPRAACVAAGAVPETALSALLGRVVALHGARVVTDRSKGVRRAGGAAGGAGAWGIALTTTRLASVAGGDGGDAPFAEAPPPDVDEDGGLRALVCQKTGSDALRAANQLLDARQPGFSDASVDADGDPVEDLMSCSEERLAELVAIIGAPAAAAVEDSAEIVLADETQTQAPTARAPVEDSAEIVLPDETQTQAPTARAPVEDSAEIVLADETQTQAPTARAPVEDSAEIVLADETQTQAPPPPPSPGLDVDMRDTAAALAFAEDDASQQHTLDGDAAAAYVAPVEPDAQVETALSQQTLDADASQAYQLALSQQTLDADASQAYVAYEPPLRAALAVARPPASPPPPRAPPRVRLPSARLMNSLPALRPPRSPTSSAAAARSRTGKPPALAAAPAPAKWWCDACTFLNEPKDATCDVCDSPMPEAEAARLRDAAAPPPVLPLLAADPRLQQIPEPEAAAPKRKPRDALAQFLRRNAPPKKKRRARFFAA